MLWIAARLTGIVLFNTLISLIGQATITGFLYNIVFTYVLPSGQHKKVASLKRDIVKNRLELKNTSAQDEFSKWAKMRRTVDKQVAELEALNASLASHRSRFNSYGRAIIFIATTGLQWSFTTRYSRDAIVYLPKDWFGPLTWFLGLPFAPAGALSCGIYLMLVRRVIGIVTRIVTDVVQGVRGEQVQPTPIAVPAEAKSGREPASGQTAFRAKKAQ